LVVAVSKTVGIGQIARAIDCGVTDFAENRTNVLKDKHAIFPNQNWHFIGRMQTNKVKDFIGRTKLVHSVAGERSLLAIDKRAAKLEIVQDVLIEINISGETTKDGVFADKLEPLLNAAAALSSVRVRGLMTMAPQGDRPAAQKCFEQLRVLRDITAPKYQGVPNVELTELSMGMTEDFDLAIEEGATIVRIGRLLWR
jgi:pyridoxal phosphate enzyme (YggS family)